MIFVDRLRPCGAPWNGGVACHMVSDEARDELVGFADLIGLQRHWLQAGIGTFPHFDISPGQRRRALESGAVATDRAGIVAAMRRYRAAIARCTAIPDPYRGRHVDRLR